MLKEQIQVRWQTHCAWNSTMATGHFISTRCWLVLGLAQAAGGYRLAYWQRWVAMLLTEPEAKQAPTLSPTTVFIIAATTVSPSNRLPPCSSWWHCNRYFCQVRVLQQLLQVMQCLLPFLTARRRHWSYTMGSPSTQAIHLCLQHSACLWAT